jgi:superoxide reductase
MEEIHWIEWVRLNTDKGTYRKRLSPGQAPSVLFQLNNEQPLAVYAYCNLHGLWKTELN